MTLHRVFFERLQDDRDLDRAFWKKHPELKKQLVDDLYSDRAHVLYELLQNAEYVFASRIDFTLSENRFTFQHNGKKLFTESNVEAITDVSKPDKPPEVRRFGIGFKSVFKFTDTPHIYSGSFAFRIVDFVYPEIVEPVQGLDSDTYFEFPLNAANKLAADAFAEIESGLQGLAETTLVFLTNIKLIRWQIGDSKLCELERVPHSTNHFEVRSKLNGEPIASVHFLRFDQAAEGLEEWQVAIAFALEFLPNIGSFNPEQTLAMQMKIVPAIPGRVSILLPAEKETSGLRFHVNAPFEPELSCASIKENPTLNDPYFEQLAKLTATSLHEIRDLGLLTADFLGVLPHPHDIIPVPYRCIRSAIVHAMQNQRLTPTYGKLHEPSKRLLQAKAPLKALLSAEDLRFLLQSNEEALRWAISAPPRNIDADRFLKGLEITSWDLKEFVDLLEAKAKVGICRPDAKFEAWLRAKPEEWYQDLYALLFSEYLSSSGDRKQGAVARLKTLKIIRLSDGTLCSTDSTKCFFPSAGVEHDEILPRVAEATYLSGNDKNQQENARSFLYEIGVTEVGEAEQIEAILKQHYTAKNYLPSKADLNRFIALVEKEPQKKELFAEYLIFEGDDGEGLKPSQVFLDVPFLETGLSAYHEPLGKNATRFALACSYQDCEIQIEDLVKFAVAVGVQSCLKIDKAFCWQNPDETLIKHAPGNNCGTGINRDYTIVGLQNRLSKADEALSRLVWKTLCKQPNSNWTTAHYSNNASQTPRNALSQLGCVLRDSKWIPQMDEPCVRFVRPAEASRDLLPDDFEYASWPWLKAIRFGEETQRKAEERQQKMEIAKKLGFADDESLARARQFSELPQEEQVRILERARLEPSLELSEHASKTPNRPVASSRNPARRQERVAKDAKNATPVDRQPRVRKIRVNWETKKDARTTLRRLNTNEDGELVCQVCGVVPFKRDNGAYYFVAVECVRGLDRELPENHIALCPDCAAKFRHANGTPSAELKQSILAAGSLLVPVILARQKCDIYFTEVHLQDLQTALRKVGG